MENWAIQAHRKVRNCHNFGFWGKIWLVKLKKLLQSVNTIIKIHFEMKHKIQESMKEDLTAIHLPHEEQKEHHQSSWQNRL